MTGALMARAISATGFHASTMEVCNNSFYGRAMQLSLFP
jgi:hypothetical protein